MNPPPVGLALALEQQAKLCEELEALADGLPRNIDASQCLRVATQILPVLQQAHTAEQTLLFPDLLSRCANAASIVSNLRLEQAEDQSYGEEVEAELIDLIRGNCLLPPDAMGYMLRSFFGGMRRHIRHVRDVC